MIAKKYSLPILATSDTHNLKYLDKSYAVLDLEEKTIESVFSAIKNKKIENFSEPMLMKEMLYYFTSQEIKNMFYKK